MLRERECRHMKNVNVPSVPNRTIGICGQASRKSSFRSIREACLQLRASHVASARSRVICSYAIAPGSRSVFAPNSRGKERSKVLSSTSRIRLSHIYLHSITLRSIIAYLSIFHNFTFNAIDRHRSKNISLGKLSVERNS